MRLYKTKKIKKHSMGFTLIELIIAVAIAAILSMIAIPSYQALVTDTRLSTQANEFLSTVMFARSEAVKRNARVTLCKSSNGLACTVDGNWAQGWIVFVDVGTIGTYDAVDKLLRVHGSLAGRGVTLVGNVPALNYISYLGTGYVASDNGFAANDGTLTLCTPVATVLSRTITIAKANGRASIAKDAVAVVCS